MNQQKIILVTGATGGQGSSVAYALLRAGQYRVRCLTRFPLSEKAQLLQRAGAEIVQGDFDNPESIDKAVAGCYGVFGVTNFWEHFTKEFEQGLTLIDAVKKAGVQHFVFSTLPDYNKLSGFRLEVPHCDLKAELERYTVLQGIPSTFVHIAFYYENFLSFFPPQPGEDGRFHFGFPQGDTPLAMASVDDLGPIVAAVFGRPASYIGRTIGVVGEDDTCTAYADTMTRILGKPVQYNYIPKEIYATFNFPGAEELAGMFEVQRLYIRGRRQHLQESYCMHPGMQSFETWLLRNKQQFSFLQKNSIASSEL